MSKKQFIKDLEPNMPVESIFVVLEREKALTRNNQAYISLTLADKTGRINGKIWDNVSKFDKAFEKGDVVKISGVATLFRGLLQIRVDDIKKCREEEIDNSDFLPVTERDRDALFKRLLNTIESIQDPFLRTLLKNIFSKEKIVKGIKDAPASISIHHTYIGGLLEHTLNVTKICETMADIYPEINRDLLITGALLHDIGKIDEYTFDRAIERTDSGRLIGHIAIETTFLSKEIDKIDDFPDELRMELLHLILSHHGEYEYGSPKIPQTIEAAALAYADMLDSKVESFIEVTGKSKKNWSDYVNFLGRKIYKKRD